MTVSQLAQRAKTRRDSCSSILSGMVAHGLAKCLNTTARRSRVYWLTNKGLNIQEELTTPDNKDLSSELPEIDWALYGWICFSHREAVLKALDHPLQPSAIAKQARRDNPKLRMSANNVRDVITAFTDRDIVRSIHVHRKAHQRYELTAKGRALQILLVRAEQPRTSS